MGRYRRPDSKNARWASPGWARERTTGTRDRVELLSASAPVSGKRLSYVPPVFRCSAGAVARGERGSVVFLFESRAFNQFVSQFESQLGFPFLSELLDDMGSQRSRLSPRLPSALRQPPGFSGGIGRNPRPQDADFVPFLTRPVGKPSAHHERPHDPFAVLVFAPGWCPDEP